MTDTASLATFLRSHDRERYLASLFVPAPKRPAVMAIQAFNAEIARVRDMVSEPLPGEVRLQWWRDTLMGDARGDVAAHPIAAALLGTIDRERLPVKPFLDLIDARTFDLYDDAMPTVRDLEGYCGETASSLFRLAALVLAEDGNPGPPDAAGHAGVAYAIAGLLRVVRTHAARGQCYVPLEVLSRHGATRDMLVGEPGSTALKRAFEELVSLAQDHLDKARVQLGRSPKAVHPAFRVLAIVPPILARMRATGFDLLASECDVPQWRKQWAMWRWQP